MRRHAMLIPDQDQDQDQEKPVTRALAVVPAGHLSMQKLGQVSVQINSSVTDQNGIPVFTQPRPKPALRGSVHDSPVRGLRTRQT